MFELRRATAPSDGASLAAALAAATEGLTAAGWDVVASIASPVAGARGALELLLHARRGGTA
jgi:predicted rRNA methylase YqxC with S4 and FtsJ domains